jgi:thioesterase domain-containing protein
LDDNFFEVGGNSLDGIRLLSEVKISLGIDLQFYHLDKYPVIQELANLINQKINNKTLVKENNFILLNEKKNKNIFSFPSIPGYGIEYKTLAKYLSDHSVYSFDLFGQENAISEYSKIITEIQPSGDYFLLGYSTGGILAFNTAVELLHSGYNVSNLILIDSPSGTERMIWDDPEQFENEYSQIAGNYQNFGMKLDHLKERIKKNLQFIRNLTYSGKIRTDIHYIKSGDIYKNDERDDWSEKTSGRIKYYAGSGNHFDMLKEPNLRINSEIINLVVNNKIF